MDGAGLWVVGTIHQAANAGMDRSSRAHGARLNCSKQFAVAEPVITNISSRFAQRYDFSMRGGIAVGEIAIPSSSNDAPGLHHHCSHWHFTPIQCALRTAEGLLHPKFVGCVAGKTVGGSILPHIALI
jgi:hypothetical protein